MVLCQLLTLTLPKTFQPIPNQHRRLIPCLDEGRLSQLREFGQWQTHHLDFYSLFQHETSPHLPPGNTATGNSTGNHRGNTTWLSHMTNSSFTLCITDILSWQPPRKLQAPLIGATWVHIWTSTQSTRLRSKSWPHHLLLLLLPITNSLSLRYVQNPRHRPTEQLTRSQRY